MGDHPASARSPSTPIRSHPDRAVLQRSFTVPANIRPGQDRPDQHGSSTSAGVDTLFIHPSARIVSFKTTSKSATSTPSSNPSLHDHSPCGTPWQSPTERTIAAGHLEIYRIPGSVSFLHSGTLLHAILPRSQCWCVDGVSKFAFRVLPETYYRIELPSVTEQDKDRVEQLIATLKMVLFYERTPCPFKRGFHVELDTDALEFVRQQQSKSSDRPLEPAKKWKLDGIWRPEDQIWARRLEEKTGRSYKKACAEDLTAHRIAFDVGMLRDCTPPAASLRPSHLAKFRSITSPPSWARAREAIQDPAPRQRCNEIERPETENAKIENPAVLEAAQYNSVGSTRSSSSTTTPTRPEPQPELYDPSTIDSDELSDHVSGGSPENVPVYGRCNLPTITPTSSPRSFWSPNPHDDDDFWGATPLSPPNRHFRRADHAPAAEPHSSPLSSSKPSPGQIRDDIAKGYANFLGPPAQLVSAMLRIAAKIAADALSISLHTPSGKSRHVPGSWELSDDDDDDWDMSDYGFPLRPDRD